MFGSAILDVAAGLFLVYLLLSIVCTALNEAISSMLQQRGKHLFEGIKNLLNDPGFTGLAQQIYNHGLVDGLSRDAADPNKPTRKPSYMPAGTFSLALLDILTAKGALANSGIGAAAGAGAGAGAPNASNSVSSSLEQDLAFGVDEDVDVLNSLQ